MFFEQLENLCKKHGTTATAFVTSVLGMGNSNVTRWKNGTMPNSDVVIKLAEYFNVTTDYLLLGKNSVKTYEDNKEQQEPPNDSEIEQLVKEYKDLDQIGRLNVRATIIKELQHIAIGRDVLTIDDVEKRKGAGSIPNQTDNNNVGRQHKQAQ